MQKLIKEKKKKKISYSQALLPPIFQPSFCPLVDSQIELSSTYI